jgi:hypothetical protein
MNGRNRSRFGVNVLTGIGAKRGDVRPFAQLRRTMSDQGMAGPVG